ncbi:hypothetical protein [Phenylobacterium sp.]|uniref:hypothetical protein n=1 Tax=Phenylobacterium sp. TaxID=1871053 RepID=UPI002811BB1D|nr:hypothetical protein [Phenylobacterium sp.]
MLALLAAAAVAASSSTPAVTVLRDARAPERCGYWLAEPVARRAPDAPAAQKLGELPRPNLELTVLRADENGCSKAVIVRENVSGDGRFAKPRD